MKKNMLSRVLTLALAALLALSLFACGKKNNDSSTSTSGATSYKVGICNYVDDASLNQIVDNIKTQLAAIGQEKGVTFEISYDNCNTDSAVLNQIIANFMADKVDLMIGVATPVAVAMQHLHAKPAPIESIAPDVPPAIIHVCMMAMEKNPKYRYQSAMEMAAELRLALEGRTERMQPRLVEAMATRHLRYNATLDELAKLEQAGSVFVIRPAKDLGLGRTEKNLEKLTSAYRAGYAQAQRLYPALKAFLAQN